MADIKESGNIKAISTSSIHKICSGQVVLTLATAIKELVENSLDAGATIIEVKLKEYGSELIEVVDNGQGVKECDFESLTLKHHTSKLEDFSDLISIATFGFRGEALSSLCALSNLTIVTCHKDSTLGTRLEYDNSGALVKKSPVSRQVGTTVSLQNLFFTLPVRHKELHRNLRREFGKMIHLLTAYCLVCTDKRITCVNQTDKGKKTVVLSTNGASTVRDNITCVFGAKQVNNLKELIQRTPSECVLAEFYLTKPSVESLESFRLKGHISSCAHGDGRSSADRQFFFINGRPCDLPKVSKVVNEVYHSFNKHQFPFVFLDISLEKDAVDVNVTPDKRKIFVQHEKHLLAAIKSSLLHIYDQQPSIINSSPLGITTDNKSLRSIMSVFASSVKSEEYKSPLLSSLKRSSTFDTEDSGIPALHAFKSQRVSESAYCFKDHSVRGVPNASPPPADGKKANENISCSDNSSVSNPSSNYSSPKQDPTFKAIISDSESLHTGMNIGFQEPVAAPEFNHCSDKNNSESLSSSNKNVTEHSQLNSLSSCVKNDSTQSSANFTVTVPFSENKAMHEEILKTSKSIKSSPLSDILKFCRTPPEKSISMQINALQTGDKSFIKKPSNRLLDDFVYTKSSSSAISSQNSDWDVEVDDLKSSTDSGCEISQEVSTGASDESENRSEQSAVDLPVQRRKKVTCCTFSMASLKQKLKSKERTISSKSCEFRRFRSKILPTENESAEDELRREISKDMFSQLEIIGQFNLGFIITRLNSDLFIIDQHATDEKYNYEMLQKDGVLKTQKLLIPQKLELTAISEATLLENINIFEKNGFKFTVNEDEKPGQRVCLVSVPVSQNWSFGKEDVDELIFMLTDNSGRMCRPSRVNQMFASRACRKSVMIGTHLSIQDMKKLVSHMGEIEQPWNCPHGRPTMRHLFSLNIL